MADVALVELALAEDVEVVEVRVASEIQVVEVITPGIQGPPGERGPAGSGYEFTQSSPATVWTIAHNLGRYPVVALYTVGGVLMLAEVVNLNPNTCQVVLDEPMAGKAILI